ncbi:hypothetical protein [Streptomyces lomondensis]|uniref:Uncharacterized protein n=1 Tax=Streptomyces lomondensis TaxID=68229 RepID=A0ABQ2X6S4_9ACTN|nr:hypothetical protein [Streptomyces lomondensis]GGX02138.1 hypothetical protein GCM10010383_35410 [Streptomyces lomondensis]
MARRNPLLVVDGSGLTPDMVQMVARTPGARVTFDEAAREGTTGP